jgi:hypothetical protein
MADLERRIRAIMKREKLTCQQVSECADVSTQAVHKWLSTGTISDEKARVLAREIGLDWLWLKHGVTRLPLDTLYDAVLNSTANVGLTCWDTLELLAIGKNISKEFEYTESEVLGKSVMHLAPGLKQTDIHRGQKLLLTLSGFVDYSFRINFHDKYTVRPYLLRGRGTTRDHEGLNYAIEELQSVEPDGTEDTLKSFRIRKRGTVPLSEQEIDALVYKYPEHPWLSDL